MKRYIKKMEEARRLEAKLRATEKAKTSTPPAVKETVPPGVGVGYIGVAAGPVQAETRDAHGRVLPQSWPGVPSGLS
jgi:hypothetical protein